MEPRPYVLVNMAMTADGKIDTVERRGARISGPDDTVRVDRLRASSDAVMVGGRTLLAEDPRLTVRDPQLVAGRVGDRRPPQPTKVGIASTFDGAAIDKLEDGAFVHDGGGRVVLCTSSRTAAADIERLESLGVVVVARGEERVDLPGTLAALADLGIERLMVEGGSTLVASLLEAGLVDELQLAIAPLLFGGETAPTPVGGPGWIRDDALELHLDEVSSDRDGDVIVRYLVGGPER